MGDAKRRKQRDPLFGIQHYEAKLSTPDGHNPSIKFAAVNDSQAILMFRVLFSALVAVDTDWNAITAEFGVEMVEHIRTLPVPTKGMLLNPNRQPISEGYHPNYVDPNIPTHSRTVPAEALETFKRFAS